MTVVRVATKKHACARCGKLSTAEHMVYSAFTHLRYCADINGCDRRSKRRAK